MANAEPTRWQYFVASAWPVRIWLGVHVLGSGGAAAYLLLSAGPIVTDVSGVVLFGAVLLCGASSGFPAGLLTGAFVLGPWMRARGNANGAPYVIGDRVRILARSHRDQLADVYEVWDARSQVRLDLGPEHRRRFADVFGYTQVLRMRRSGVAIAD